MNNYHFNDSQWRALLDQPDVVLERETAETRDYVLLPNGDVFRIGGKRLDDNNDDNVEDQGDD